MHKHLSLIRFIVKGVCKYFRINYFLRLSKCNFISFESKTILLTAPTTHSSIIKRQKIWKKSLNRVLYGFFLVSFLVINLKVIDNYDRGYYISKRGKNGKGGITLSTFVSSVLSKQKAKNGHKNGTTEKHHRIWIKKFYLNKVFNLYKILWTNLKLEMKTWRNESNLNDRNFEIKLSMQVRLGQLVPHEWFHLSLKSYSLWFCEN